MYIALRVMPHNRVQWLTLNGLNRFKTTVKVYVLFHLVAFVVSPTGSVFYKPCENSVLDTPMTLSHHLSGAGRRPEGQLTLRFESHFGWLSNSSIHTDNVNCPVDPFVSCSIAIRRLHRWQPSGTLLAFSFHWKSLISKQNDSLQWRNDI